MGQSHFAKVIPSSTSILMNKEIPKTDRVTFITEKNNWLDAGGVKELKMNKSKDVVQIHFENGNIAEIHSCNPYGEGRGALVVSDLVSLANSIC
jgi:hypothetical protein